MLKFTTTRLSLIFPVIFFVIGCATQETQRKHYDRSVQAYGFDFTEYTEEGFLITPLKYPGKYSSVGQLRIVIYPEASRGIVQNPNETTDFSEWRQENVDPAVAIDSLHSKAQALGADAIIHFQTEVVTQSIEDGVRRGVEASGFAIDRKD